MTRLNPRLSYQDPSHIVVHWEIDIQLTLAYKERPIEILDYAVKTLRNKEIPLVKVLWRNHNVEEATWKRQQDMMNRYPELFS